MMKQESRSTSEFPYTYNDLLEKAKDLIEYLKKRGVELDRAFHALEKNLDHEAPLGDQSELLDRQPYRIMSFDPGHDRKNEAILYSAVFALEGYLKSHLSAHPDARLMSKVELLETAFAALCRFLDDADRSKDANPVKYTYKRIRQVLSDAAAQGGVADLFTYATRSGTFYAYRSDLDPDDRLQTLAGLLPMDYAALGIPAASAPMRAN
jgi:hypothetical protein